MPGDNFICWAGRESNPAGVPPAYLGGSTTLMQVDMQAWIPIKTSVWLACFGQPVRNLLSLGSDVSAGK